MALEAQEILEKMMQRVHYRNQWHTDLATSIKADFPFCLFSMICCPCASYILRKRALYNDMSRYKCCAGYAVCSGRCGERKWPGVCLALEVICCLPTSVASTRFLLQDQLNIQPTKCDNCIIGIMIIFQQLSCIYAFLALVGGTEGLQNDSDFLEIVFDVLFCLVCACMQTQHKVEMDKRDGKFGTPSVMLVPIVQQMSRMDQPFLLPPGYPPANYNVSPPNYYPPADYASSSSYHPHPHTSGDHDYPSSS